LGWEGTQGIDGFGLAYAGSTANFRVNLLGENSAAVNYESPNGRLQWQGAGSVFDRNITRQLNETVRSTESSEWWFTIMVNRLGWVGDPAFNTFAVGGFTDATGNGLQVGYGDEGGDGTPDLILRSNGINTVLLADAPSSDNQFVIVRLDIDPAGNDTIAVWVDPDSVVTPPAPDITITDQDLFSTLNPFTQSKFESPGQSGSVFFDEIRLGTEFATVVQPPLPPVLPGDFNADGVVDAADYTVWRDNLGAADESALNGAGDGINGVDANDYALWRSQFGTTATLALGAATAVPEPTGVVLALLFGAAALVRRNR
jgi:hypothetical protein